MRRYFTTNGKRFLTAAGFAGLFLELLMALTLSTAVRAQGPARTTVSDTVYRADGTAASGVALISWPSFQTVERDTVAAGNESVTIGTGGAFVAQLVPNVGASPTGTYYVVVFQLDDGTVRTEYWVVPTTSPTTIAAVRTTPGTALGNLMATQQYVNTAVANRAIDSTVVHVAGAETITGAKQFAVAPSLPPPAGTNDAANKGYVDAAVGNVGSGSYVSKAGDTMTGPLTLPGPPAAPNQASDKQYVDSGLSAKADMVSGLVPAGELGSGVASSATCLTGNSTWGTCGGGAPAGITYATTALNWSQTIMSALTGGSQATVTLTPCPIGIDTTSGAGYQVLISGSGNSEAVNVPTATGGCTSGAASGTITFTPFFSYPPGYTIGSASSGVQETINSACGVDPTSWKNRLCSVTLPSSGPGYPTHSLNTYNVAGTIYFHSNESVLSGYGASLNCTGRGACLQIGDLAGSNDFTNNTVAGLGFRSPTNLSNSPAFEGTPITQTQRTSQVVTITTASAHGFRAGDMVTILFTDNSAFWGDAIVTSVPSPTTFQYAHSGGDVAAQTTPGVVALAYIAVLDNSMNTHLNDIVYDGLGGNGWFNNFFDIWDDENVTIDHFNNNAGSMNANANWTGSFVFSSGNQGAQHQIAPVISLRDSTITANYSNGITVYNSNGLYVENTVVQATGPWQVYSSNSTGNYQGAYLKNIYSESSASSNPLSPAKSPFPGTGVAGLIAGSSSGAASFSISGSGGTQGWFATGGSGSTAYSYFVVAKDITSGTQTSPMQILNYGSTGSDSIPVRWPRVANGTDVITYDLIRAATPVGAGGTYPYAGGCLGGPTTACGAVATNIAQCSGLVCTYTDNGATGTTSYTILQGSYSGNLIFWPGSIVSVNKSVTTDSEEQNVVGVGLTGNPIQVTRQCTSYGVSSPGGYTSCQASITTANNSSPNAAQTATLMTDGDSSGGAAGTPLPTKGRLNFSMSPFAALQPHHFITLVDSQAALTRATPGYRPSASANDTWIGTDVAPGGVSVSQGQLAFGAPIAITNYIAATGDGVTANWLERLTLAAKEFNVPVKFDQGVTVTGLANGCLNIASGVITSTGSPCGSGGGGSVSSVFGRAGVVTASTGDYTVAQITGAAADASVVHNTGTETIGGAKTFTNNVVVSGNLILPQGSAYVPAAGGIGLDTAAGMPVVNISGTNYQVALTSSNISGQAGTALALAGTPTQCSGAFATGIAANGNANCTTPNVIQLAETTQPAGIPNWGVFWFDRATHSPHVIESNGQVVQLGLTNLFNLDPGGDPADSVDERNGTAPQSLRVYSSYVSDTAWDRISLGSETIGGTNYNVLRSEDATSGNALSLGMHIGSGIKWFFASDGNFKPNTDNSYDMGTDSGQAMRSVFAKTSFNMYSTGRQDFEFLNDSANGTTLTQLAVYNGGGTGVQTAGTANTDGVIGIVSGGAGTSGKAVVTWAGLASCNFDAGSPAAGDYAIASTTQAGKCHDTGSSNRPTGVQVIGRIEAGGVRVSLGPPSGGGGGGAVSSVFGRTGAVSAASGDYSVSQVAGAAPLASPTFSGVMTHPDGTSISTAGWAGSPTFLSNVTINGNLNVAGNISQTSSSPTQWSGKEWTGTTATVPSGMDFSLGVGSDGTFLCQLASGASCMSSGGGAVTSVFGRTGAVVAQSVDIPNNGANTTGTAANLSGTPALPNGTTATTQSSGDNSGKLASTAYVRNEIYLTWTCPVAGATTSGVSYCNWTLPAGMTITGFDLSASTAPAGCTTYPTLQVWDGTSNAEVGGYSVTMTSGSNFYGQVTGSTNIASGHLLRVRVTTGGAGCSTSPAGVVAVVTYQMQN